VAKKLFLALVLSVLGSLASSGHVVAATKASQPVGISISPFLQDITVSGFDDKKTFTVTLTNHTNTIQELTLTSRDFGSLNDTGGLIFEGSKGYSQKYGLASWLTLEKDTVTLQPNESGSVLATIDNRTTLQPGGHYGAIVASIGKLDAPQNQTITIDQQLVSLVLVTKTGGEHYDLKLKRIDQNGNWIHLPNTVTLHFQNPGNVHVIPRGIVKLKSPNGTVLARGIINDASSIVLPQSFRDIPVSLTTVGHALPLPGRYRVEVMYRYEGYDRFATKSINLQFINLGMYLLLAAVLIVAVFVLKSRQRKQHKKPADK
jgi:hypothetical protein